MVWRGEWLTSLNPRPFKKQGISPVRATIERGMEAIRDEEIALYCRDGRSEEDAIRLAGEVVRFERSEKHGMVGQIRRSEMHLLKAWAIEEKHWGNYTDLTRLTKCGLPRNPERMDYLFARLYREWAQPMREQGLSERVIRYTLEEKGIRRGPNAFGRPVWQFDDRIAPFLRKELGKEEQAEQAQREERINSRNGSGLQELGAILIRTPGAHALIGAHRDRLICRRITNLGEPLAQAEETVNQWIAPASTRFGEESWDISRAYVPELLAAITPQLRQYDENWWSPSSHQWKDCGINASAPIIAKAMQQLREDTIATRRAGGMSESDAEAEVATNLVREGVNSKGKPSLLAHKNCAPELKAIVETMPHRAAYLARAEKRASGHPQRE